jgi:hypothetical protein
MENKLKINFSEAGENNFSLCLCASVAKTLAKK